MPTNRRHASLLGPLIISLASSAAGQNAHSTPPKEVQFEVFSIRPMTTAFGASHNASPTPTGFSSRLSLWEAIMVAYGPANPVNWGSVEILNTPKWIGTFYDFKGTVSQADRNAWLHQGSDHELLRSALRLALKDRCKLALHEKPAKAEVFELVQAKTGARLKPPSPNPPPASVIKTASGGSLLQTTENDAQVKQFYGATMDDLVAFLCIMSGRTPVRDKTGLNGRYDFKIRQIQLEGSENHVYSYPVNQLGLQINPATESRPMLVIDHIEQPTAN